MKRVAIVTPYYDEPIEWLQQCHESVLAQSYPTTHIMVADGKPRSEIERWYVKHIALPHRHADFGDTAKAIGAIEAMGGRYDAIGFLDADNWLGDEHVETCVAAAERERAAFVSTKRYLCRVDGSLMGVCLNSDGEEFVDTNVMFFMREAFELAMEWARLEPEQHAICDRVVWHRLKQSRHRRCHVDLPTVHYRVTQPSIYRYFDEPIPTGADHDPAPVARALDRWEERGGPSLRFDFRARRIRPDDRVPS